MGPRFFDRGNAMSGIAFGNDFLLQWGRGSLTAETWRWTDQAMDTKPASMGPRFFDRGNNRTMRDLVLRDWASMGPRFFDRGNKREPITWTTLPTASMGPRFFDRGNRWSCGHQSLMMTALQWGRGSLTAETRLASGHRARGPSLQWGRGSLTAETLRFADRTCCTDGFNGAAVL